MLEKQKSKRNKTIDLNNEEIEILSKNIFYPDLDNINKFKIEDIINKTINSDFFKIIDYFPKNIFDLIILDPPYNIFKKFDNIEFKELEDDKYKEYFDLILKKLTPLIKENGTIYVCCDWKTSPLIYDILKKYFIIRNRITWEREKGRGAKSNFKNCSEDIWFATKSKNYKFYIDRIKLKRRVLAPYKENGNPKDWYEASDGKYRLTYPSNIWFDITVPFWSMPENTSHPTQKPEKLIAKLILASSDEGDFVFDPFLGSGTTSVVSKKLKRNYCGIEISKYFCMITEKRLKLAQIDSSIQGYYDGFFLERNSLNIIKNNKN